MKGFFKYFLVFPFFLSKKKHQDFGAHHSIFVVFLLLSKKKL